MKPLLILVRLAQKEHYPTLINYLREDGVQPVSRDLVNFANQLGLYLDKFDLIRCHGRVEHSPLSLYSKDPVLLPPKSALTNQITLNIHETHHHAGVNTILVIVREQFWIPQARRQIKGIVKGCVTCQKLWKQPVKLPLVPPLPEERVNYNRPF